MAKSRETYNKKEKEKKRQQAKQQKAEKKAERKASGGSGKSLDDMMAYVDADGNIVDTPPDPSQRREVALEDIQIGVPKHVEEEYKPRQGRVSFFDEGKGFGFIIDKESGERVFVHANNLQGPLKEGQMVEFDVEMGPRGASAVNVNVK